MRNCGCNFCSRGILGWPTVLLGLCEMLSCTGISLLFLAHCAVKMNFWVFPKTKYWRFLGHCYTVMCCVKRFRSWMDRWSHQITMKLKISYPHGIIAIVMSQCNAPFMFVMMLMQIYYAASYIKV